MCQDYLYLGADATNFGTCSRNRDLDTPGFKLSTQGGKQLC